MMSARGETYGIFPAKELNSLRAVREVSTVPIAMLVDLPIGSDETGS
jgi:hypothetical protein